MRSLLADRGRGARARSHSSSAGEAEPLAVGDLVQHLAEVVEVGEQPLAVRAGRAPGAASPSATTASCTAAMPRRAEQVEPAADPLARPRR